MNQFSEAAAASPRTLDVELLPERPRVGSSLMAGLLAGVIAVHLLDLFTGGELSWLIRALVGAATAIGVATGANLLARRKVADHLRVSREAVMVTRGPWILRKVTLAKLTEIDEIQTADGPVLLVGDEREMLAITASRLVNPREYASITDAIVEAMRALDPTGERGRMAVQAGRTRAAIAHRPARVSMALTAAIALPSLLAFGALEAVRSHPFPMELIGAMSGPLLYAGETWRLLSYVFLHAGGLHLMFNMLALLWLSSYLEKLLGWERVVLAFVAGAVVGAAGHAGLSTLPMVGASGGVFGLFGLLASLAIFGGHRLPRWLLPRPSFWVINVALSVTLPMIFPQISWAAHLGGAAAGVLVGVIFVAGVGLPPQQEERREARPFAVLALAALALGLIGGATHAAREHPDDDEIVARALMSLEPGLESARLQNDIAYTMVATDAPSPASVDIGSRLAALAVENSGRSSPAILDTLAVARFRAGKLDEARALFEEALSLTEEPRLRRLLEQRIKDVDAGGPLTPEEVF